MSQNTTTVKRRRDLAIDAAIRRIIIAMNPDLSECEVQKRGGMQVSQGEGHFLVTFDAQPLVHITLEGDHRFVLTIL